MDGATENHFGSGPRAGRAPAIAAIAVYAALGVWVALCAYYPLTDTDIWWHLASARRMFAEHAFLRADPFCQASLGKPWIDLHWGFQLIAYGLWKLGGAAALLSAKVAALWLAAALCLRPHLRRRSGRGDAAWFLLPLACFGVYHVRFYLDVRPLVVTLLGLAAEYTVVTGFLAGRLRRPWLLLIPIQAVLANVQGLYLLGAFLVSCFAIGEWLRSRSRTLLWNAAPLWFTGLLTPYGWRAFVLPFALLGRITPTAGNVFSSGIAENLPWLSLLKQDPRAALPFALFTAWVLFTFGRARGKTGWGHVLLFGGFTGLSLMAVRNMPLAWLAGLMAAGRNLEVTSYGEAVPGGAQAREAAGPLRERKGSAGGATQGRQGAVAGAAQGRQGRTEGAGQGRKAAAAGALAMAVLAAVYVPRIREAWSYELPGLMTPFRFPAGAVDYMEAHPLPGNLFNELRFGGYLEWRLPGSPVFLDGRMILRDAAFYREFLAVVDGEEDFTPYRARYGFTHALLPIAEDKRYLPLAARLLGGGWDLLYADGAAALLAQPGLAPTLALSVDSLPASHPVRAALQARFGSNAKLEAIAAENLRELFAAAGKSRAAADLGAIDAPPGPPPGAP